MFFAFVFNILGSPILSYMDMNSEQRISCLATDSLLHYGITKHCGKQHNGKRIPRTVNLVKKDRSSSSPEVAECANEFYLNSKEPKRARSAYVFFMKMSTSKLTRS